MKIVKITGKMIKGLGVGRKFISHPYYFRKLSSILNCSVYPGTLNVETDTDWRKLASECEPTIIPPVVYNGRVLGAVYLWGARLVLSDLTTECAIIRPLKSSHPPNVLEIIACQRLREKIHNLDIAVEVECKETKSLTRTLQDT